MFRCGEETRICERLTYTTVMEAPFSIFFSSWRIVSSIWSIALPWPLVRTFTKTLFMQR